MSADWVPATSSVDLSAQALVVEGRVGGTSSAAAAFRRLGENYGDAHEGPYITVIASALVELGQVCERLVDSYQTMAEALRVAAEGIDRIDADASRKLERTDPGTGLDPYDVASLHSDELAVLYTLARDLDSVVLGASPEVNRVQLVEAASRVCLLPGTGGELSWPWPLIDGLGVGPGSGGADPLFAVAALDEAQKLNVSVGVVLDRVVDAMTKGRSPAESGLSPLLFPGSYHRAAMVARSAAGGPPMGDRLAASPESPVSMSVYDAVIAIYGLSENERWAGRRLAAQVKGDAWKKYMPDKRPYTNIGQFSDDLARDEALAVSFFNHLGPESTARLGELFPAMKPESSDQADVMTLAMQQMANAMGTAAASGQLDFGGADLINAREDWWRVHPAHLIVLSETMPDGFLFDATVAAINSGDGFLGRGPLRGLTEGPDRLARSSSQLALRLADQNLPLVLAALQAADDPRVALRTSPTAEWGELLVALTLPEITGDPNLSTEAAIWIVDAAGRDNQPLYREQAKAVEQVIFSRPTMLAQGSSAAGNLEAAGLDSEGTYLSLGRETTDRALVNIFKAGQGDYMRMLEENMPSVIVKDALVVGFHPADHATAYGTIAGSIVGAQLDVGIEDARSADARNAQFRGLLDSTIGAGIGTVASGVKLAPVFVEAFGTDQAVGQSVDLLPMLPTDQELSYYQIIFQMEIDHDLEAAVRVVAALAEGGNLVEEGMDTLLTTTDFA
ncbi:MAG: hypothetical protein GY939_18780, partial [Actinomycetia bacterium]|nr:hypothetical protein [Actinomycetes bacterium]